MHAFDALEVPQNRVGIHWFGQNSFAFKDAHGTILMVDPYFPRERPAGEFIHSIPPFDEKELKPDGVLLTHDHGDHTCLESLLRIHAAFPDVRFWGPKESILRLERSGIPRRWLGVMVAGGSERIEGIWVHSVYSKPPEGLADDGIPTPDVEHLGYVLDFAQTSIYISGDLVRTFAEHDELIAPVLRLHPELGLLTTHPAEVEFPDFAGSVKMAVKLGLKSVIPAHYGCFVRRTFDPKVWASGFAQTGIKPIVIPYNSSILYPS